MIEWMKDTIFLGLSIADYVGYIASLLVLISLLMSSIKKLRWINLAGAVIFGLYAFLIINNIPTGVMNLGIVVINVYYLIKIYTSKDYFKLQPISKDSEYFRSFLDFYNDDINKYIPLNKKHVLDSDVRLYVLRNMTPAGLFTGNILDKDTLVVELDYAVPQYRDFKIAAFVFEDNKDYFKKQGFKQFLAYSDEQVHINYLKKMGFVESNINGKLGYIKEI